MKPQDLLQLEKSAGLWEGHDVAALLAAALAGAPGSLYFAPHVFPAVHKVICDLATLLSRCIAFAEGILCFGPHVLPCGSPGSYKGNTKMVDTLILPETTGRDWIQI